MKILGSFQQEIPRRNFALTSHRISPDLSRLKMRRRFGGLQSPISLHLCYAASFFVKNARKKPELGNPWKNRHVARSLSLRSPKRVYAEDKAV